jgi:hypothetical protein
MMTRSLVNVSAAAALSISAIAMPSTAHAFEPWTFVAGAVFGAVVGPAYGFPFGYRSGYAPVAPMAPWAAAPPECHWARVQQNGAWRHARVCYEPVQVVAGDVPPGPPIISK